MKKMIAFLLLGIGLFAVQNFKDDNFDLFADCQKVVLVSDAKYDDLTGQIIENGEEYIHIIEKEDLTNLQKIISDYDFKGISLYFSLEKTFDEFNKIFDFALSQNKPVEDYDVYYGFYDGYKDFRYIDGKKINVQLVRTGDCWIAGFPLVLAGF